MTALVQAIGLLLRVLEAAVIVRVLYSWLDPDPYPGNTLKRALWSLTDPILEPLRRVIPPLGMFDISPLVALIALQVLGELIAAWAVPGGY